MEQLLSLVLGWIRDLRLFEVSAATLPKLLIILGMLTTAVQGLKKAIEWLSTMNWVQNVPGLGSVLNVLAHGNGPKIINIALTVVVMGAAALNDGVFSGGEATEIIGTLLTMLGISLGNDLTYKAIRTALFPKDSVQS